MLLSCCLYDVQAEMFKDALSFNQDIGNWDVSSGTNFVSMAKAFTSLVNQFEMFFSYDLLLLFVRLVCLMVHHYLTKTLGNGMSLLVNTL